MVGPNSFDINGQFAQSPIKPGFGLRLMPIVQVEERLHQSFLSMGSHALPKLAGFGAIDMSIFIDRNLVVVSGRANRD